MHWQELPCLFSVVRAHKERLGIDMELNCFFFFLSFSGRYKMILWFFYVYVVGYLFQICGTKYQGVTSLIISYHYYQYGWLIRLQSSGQRAAGLRWAIDRLGLDSKVLQTHPSSSYLILSHLNIQTLQTQVLLNFKSLTYSSNHYKFFKFLIKIQKSIRLFRISK